MAESDETQLTPATAGSKEEQRGIGDDPKESDGDDDGDGEEKEEDLLYLSSDSESEDESEYTDDDGSSEPDLDDNSPEANIKLFTKALESRKLQKVLQDEEERYEHHEDLYDFPEDPENWKEEDLPELWADPPLGSAKPGWDPVWADEEDWEIVREEMEKGKDPPIAPFYLPYRKPYPVIPDNHRDISNPKSVIEELDRIEEFLKWVSYIFPDGSSYEGTVWDDLAHGKGVYVAEQGLVRYEGEWLQNGMEGHGVVEVEIPGVEPVPGSELEAKMRAEGRIIKRDFMSPEDKKWLEMDVEDTIRLVGHIKETPFYENDEWVKLFGKKPEKGRYRYAGQWKHGRMHGCGVYEVNERVLYGRFYFGEYSNDTTGCNLDVSSLHSGIAEVAAAKARMFVNKPDGMIREERGPYGDPQHPYFYEEEDAWMAPGFVNQFYEIPDYWKTYVEEIDKEREMWLNSFHKAPLRIPMPAELEHWWSKADQDTEFVLLNKDPEPDPEDPSKLIYTEDPLILHTPTGRLINYVDDEEYGVRLFWQPNTEAADVNSDKVEFLPLDYDEFFGRTPPGFKKQGRMMRFITSVENALKPLFDKLDAWAEEKKKASELNQKLIEKELEFIEAEICLEESLEDLEIELKRKQKEEEKRSASGEDGGDSPVVAVQEEADVEDEEEDEQAPASFGTVRQEETDKNTSTEFVRSKKSPFSSLSMSVSAYNPVLMAPSKLQEAFLSWKESRGCRSNTSTILSNLEGERYGSHPDRVSFVNFPSSVGQRMNLRALKQERWVPQRRKTDHPKLNYSARIVSGSEEACKSPKVSLAKRSGDANYNLSILSLHVPINIR